MVYKEHLNCRLLADGSLVVCADNQGALYLINVEGETMNVYKTIELKNDINYFTPLVVVSSLVVIICPTGRMSKW